MPLSLVAGFDPKLLRFADFMRTVGAANDTGPILGPRAAVDEFLWVWYAQGNTSDATARHSGIAVSSSTGIGGAVVRTTEGVARATAQFGLVTRDLYVPPLWEVTYEIAALSVGATISLFVVYTRMKLPRDPLDFSMPFSFVRPALP